METLTKTWHPLELLWLVLAPLIVLTTCICCGDYGTMSLISVISGILFVILVAKGKWYSFIFGIVHSILYALISYEQTLYGETIMKLGFAVPLHICGLYLWFKNTSMRTFEVIHRNLSAWGKFQMVFITFVGTIFLGKILQSMGDEVPFIDAFTTIASIHGAYLMVTRRAEQWILFIIINFVSMYMWLLRYMDNGDNIGTLIMWFIWTINSIYGYFKWNKT